MSKPRRRCEKGLVLVFVLMLSVVLIMLIFSLLMTSQFGLRGKIRTEAVAIAEAGVEFVRGSLQSDSLYGTNPPDTKANSQDLLPAGASVQLTYVNGSNVTFPSNIPFVDVAGKDAWGVLVKDTNGNPRGYFAYIMNGNDPIESYCMGCVGADPSQVEESKKIVLHVRYKPYTYSEYTKFIGNPNQPVNITGTYQDPFYCTNVWKSGSGPVSVSNGLTSYMDPGGALQSFNKTYVAGELRFYPTKGGSAGKSQFTGFSTGTYFSPRDPGPPPRNSYVRARGPSDTYDPGDPQETQSVTCDGKAGLYGLNADQLGLPPESGKSGDDAVIQKIMVKLENIAKSNKAENKGIYVSGNRTIIGDGSSPVYPASNCFTYPGDSEMYDNSNNPYKNKFLTAKEDNKNHLPQYNECIDNTYNRPKWYNPSNTGTNMADSLTGNQDTKTYWEKGGNSLSSTDWSDAFRTIDPTDDYQNREYVVKFDVLGNVGKVTISNIANDYTGGSAQLLKTGTNTLGSIPADGTTTTSQTFDISDTNGNPLVKIIYLKGNARVYGKVKGRVTVVAEGKISIGREGTASTGNSDLVYDGIDANAARTGVGKKPADIGLNTNKNLIGLITPRKIQIDPVVNRSVSGSTTDINNFAICASMMAGGSPPRWDPNLSRGNDSIVGQKFTVCARPKTDPMYTSNNNCSYYNKSGYTSKEWNNFNIYGSNVSYQRNKNYASYYATVGEYYDDRLLTYQPPYYPWISPGWNIIYWAEVNINNGDDIHYQQRSTDWIY